MREVDKARESAEFLDHILQTLPAFVMAADTQLRFTAIRGSVLQALGLDAQQITRLIGTRADVYFASPEGDAIMEHARAALTGEERSFESAWRGVWFTAHIAPMRNALGEIVGVVGVGMDTTRRHLLEIQLEAEREALNEAQELAEVGSWVLDVATGTVRISAQLARLLGIPYRREPQPFSNLEHFFHPTEYAMFTGEKERVLRASGSFDFDHQIVRPDGTIRYVRSRGHVECAQDGAPLRCVGTMLDITARVEAQRTFEMLAYHDALTGLPNRWLLRDRLTQAIALAKREQRKFYVLFVDLDDFKRINDTLGHAEGDVLLGEVGQRLKNATRGTDTVARMGGDEFVVIFTEVHSDDQLETAIGKLRQAFRAPFHLRGSDYRITASIGVAVYPDDALTEDELLQDADAAMYQAKQEGRNAVQRHHGSSLAATWRRVQLEVDLPRALRDAEFRIRYQPVVNAQTLQIVGVEALLRWDHPSRGLLLPMSFMASMEETEFMKTIGEWVIREACVQVAQWRSRFNMPLRLSVNISARQLMRDQLPHTISRALGDSGLEPGALEIEITETAIVRDLELTSAMLTEVRDMGIGIAIDDFGTGYNSLSYLKHFPVTALKIDRTFVGEIGFDSFDEAISKSVAALGKALQIRVIAQGVETRTQFDSLRALGCDELQGFYFAPPLDAAHMATKLAIGTAG
jgi:diguanylate cyclase (GGDEF)-like protein/PAS domain S-box-containing protein